MKCFLLACLACMGLQAEIYFTPQMRTSHLKSYTEEEVELIEKDLDVVRSICMNKAPDPASRFYLATAGAPGARKTTILEKFVAAHPEYQNSVYLDPDPRALKFMVHTYYNQSLTPLVLSQTNDYNQVIKNAYQKWRPASNYIALTLFEEAIEAQRSVIYGTTSTGGHTPDLFSNLKDNGYQIVLLLCSCPDDLRRQAIEYRNEVVRFYQSSPGDTVSKGKLFPQRMGDYFDHADILYFYWSDDLFSPERLAAIWKNGKLEVLDNEAFERFASKYEADRIALAREGKEISDFNSYFCK